MGGIVNQPALVGMPRVERKVAASAAQSASESVAGSIEIATVAETNIGTDDARAVTPLKVRFTKGGDIASASPLVIDTDGNYFDVTGTTGFSAMTVATGRLFVLQFDAALTMTDGASLDLAGANITTVAGDRGLFFATAADTVQLLVYQREGVAPLVYATQAEQETGTAVNVAVSPGRQQFHLSAAKVWAKFDIAGTENASHNVDSVSDTGTGDWTVNITTDFSSVNYPIVLGFREDAANGFNGHVTIGAQAAGTFQINATDSGGTLFDPAAADDMHVVAFGDQV